MEEREGQSHHVKRVVLPSGKTIEVVYFQETDGAVAQTPDPRVETQHPDAEPQRPGAEPDQDLHVCFDCESELVYPVEWEESGQENWKVLLHCPNCEVYRDGIFSQDTVEALDEELDRGTDALTRDYTRLLQANMAEEVDRFVAALHADAILPEDF